MADRISFSSIYPIADSDATAFLSAAAITDFVQSIAINELVLDLKRFSLWNKLYAIYPFVGGTANTHKFNLKDPRDLDAAYRLTYSGGLIHSATGMLPNGSTGYANTKFIPSMLASINSGSLSVYSRTDTIAGGKAEIGSVNTATSYFCILTKYTGNLGYGGINDGLTAAGAVTTSSGFYVATRTGATTIKMFKNGATVFSLGTASNTQNTLYPVVIGALMNSSGTPNNYSDRECAFASIGDGLTDIECANLYSSVQKYQGMLNRSL